jgi:hypothetical protein
MCLLEIEFFWDVNSCGLLDRYQREIAALLGYYAASSGNPLPAFRDNVSVTSSMVKKIFLTLEDWTDTLPRNVGTGLPFGVA